MDKENLKEENTNQKNDVFSKILDWGFSNSMKMFNAICLIALGILLLILYFINSVKQEDHQTQLENLKYETEILIDSISESSLKDLTRVFTWSVRAELNRENLENVNDVFNAFIKFEKVKKIQLINPKDYKVMLSTDKKTEGILVKKEDFNLMDLQVKKDSLNYQIINPIMSLDKLSGILVIDFIKNE